MKPNHEFIKIKELKLHPKNPKQHSDEQINGIAKLIDELGWGRPIIISKDKYILAGHGAVLAAGRLGYTEVPYRVMKWKHDSPEALTYLIADNKSSELATWDNKLLLDDLKELDIGKLDVKLTMFNDLELKELDINSNIEWYENDIDEDLEDIYEKPEDQDQDNEEEENRYCPKCGYKL